MQFVALIVTSMVILAGCGGATLQPQPTTDEATPHAEVTLYFGDQQATGLVAEVREINVPEGSNLYALTLQALAEGSMRSDLARVLPEGTKVLGVEVEDGVAYADFSRELQSGHWGGSAGETITVFAIVNTLTEFDEVKRVAILIEGTPLDSLAGHMDMTEPLSRAEDLIID
jgi:spore germination protein GerM